MFSTGRLEMIVREIGQRPNTHLVKGAIHMAAGINMALHGLKRVSPFQQPSGKLIDDRPEDGQRYISVVHLR
jgi:hypothetical protein